MKFLVHDIQWWKDCRPATAVEDTGAVYALWYSARVRVPRSRSARSQARKYLACQSTLSQKKMYTVLVQEWRDTRGDHHKLQAEHYCEIQESNLGCCLNSGRERSPPWWTCGFPVQFQGESRLQSHWIVPDEKIYACTTRPFGEIMVEIICWMNRDL